MTQLLVELQRLEKLAKVSVIGTNDENFPVVLALTYPSNVPCNFINKLPSCLSSSFIKALCGCCIPLNKFSTSRIFFLVSSISSWSLNHNFMLDN